MSCTNDKLTGEIAKENNPELETRETNDQILMNIVHSICDGKPIVKERSTGDLYLQIKGRTYSIRNTNFQNLIRVKYFKEKGTTVNGSKLYDVIQTYEALVLEDEDKACSFITKVDKLANRSAGSIDEGIIYYDLADDTGHVIEINSVGWKETHLDIPVFGNNTFSRPQLTPVIDKILLNRLESEKCSYWDHLSYSSFLFNSLNYNDARILMIYIIYCFLPTLNKPILILRGEDNSEDENDEERAGGSGKTTTMEYIKKIIDPSQSQMSSISNNNSEYLKLLLSKDYFVAFDNVSNISQEVSDVLCQAVTGGTHSRKKNYTDGDIVTWIYKTCVALNGINLRKLKTDLRDRAIIFNLKRRTYFITEDELESTFYENLPMLLSQIFTVLSKLLKYLDENPEELEEFELLPRMASFGYYGEIISRCMGFEKNWFINEITQKSIAQNADVGVNSKDIETHALFKVLKKWMEEVKEFRIQKDKIEKEGQYECVTWEDTPTKLFNLLKNLAVNKYNVLPVDGVDNSKLFPQKPNAMIRKLNIFKPILGDQGILIDTDARAGDEKGTKLTRIILKFTVDKRAIEDGKKKEEELKKQAVKEIQHIFTY